MTVFSSNSATMNWAVAARWWSSSISLHSFFICTFYFLYVHSGRQHWLSPDHLGALQLFVDMNVTCAVALFFTAKVAFSSCIHKTKTQCFLHWIYFLKQMKNQLNCHRKSIHMQRQPEVIKPNLAVWRDCWQWKSRRERTTSRKGGFRPKLIARLTKRHSSVQRWISCTWCSSHVVADTFRGGAVCRSRGRDVWVVV